MCFMTKEGPGIWEFLKEPESTEHLDRLLLEMGFRKGRWSHPTGIFRIGALRWVPMPCIFLPVPTPTPLLRGLCPK